MNKKIISNMVVMFFIASSSHLQASCPTLVQAPGSPYVTGAISVAYSPNGNYLAASQSQGNVTIYSINNSTGSLVFSSSADTNLTSPGATGWSPNGLFGAVIDQDVAQVRAFTINDSTGVWAPGTITSLGAGIGGGLAYSPDSRFVAIATENNANQGLGIYSVNQSTGTLTLLAHYATGANSFGVAYSPNGEFIAATSEADGVFLFSVDSATGLLTSVVGSPFTDTLDSPGSVAYSPDSQFAAVANLGNATVSVFAVNEEGLFVNTVPGSPYATGGANPGPVAYSPDGTFAAVGTGTNEIAVYSVNQVTGVFTPLTGSPFSLASSIDIISLQFSPNSTFIAAVGLQGEPPKDIINMVKLFGLSGQTAVLDFATIDAFGRVTVMGYGAQPNSTITIYANCNTVIGIGTADASGNFMIGASVLLSKGIYGITATEMISTCTTQPSNQIVVGGTLPLFIQRVVNKYSSC